MIITLKQLKAFKNIPGLYKFRFITNFNKHYIGEGDNLYDRIIRQYRNEIRKNEEHRPIINAIIKYLWENIEIEILDWGEHLKDKITRLALETAYIEFYDSLIRDYEDIKGNGYNVKLFGDGMEGYIHSEKSKQKISKANKNKPKSEEHKKNLSESRKEMYKNGYVSPFKGKHHTIESKEKLRLSRSDSNIYHFMNVKTNEEFIGTRYNFYKKYNFSATSAYRLVNNKIKSYRNWILIKKTNLL